MHTHHEQHQHHHPRGLPLRTLACREVRSRRLHHLSGVQLLRYNVSQSKYLVPGSMYHVSHLRYISYAFFHFKSDSRECLSTDGVFVLGMLMASRCNANSMTKSHRCECHPLPSTLPLLSTLKGFVCGKAGEMQYAHFFVSVPASSFNACWKRSKANVAKILILIQHYHHPPSSSSSSSLLLLLDLLLRIFLFLFPCPPSSFSSAFSSLLLHTLLLILQLMFHARMHACTHARTHARAHARMQARMYACTHARTEACTHALTHVRTHKL